MDQLIDQAIALGEQEQHEHDQQRLSASAGHQAHVQHDASRLLELLEASLPAAAVPEDDAVVPEVEACNEEETIEDDDDESCMGPMDLTEEEHQWALRIQQVIQSKPEFQHPLISDMKIAQLALVSMAYDEEGDIPKITERIRGLQRILQDYQIVDTHQDGQHLLNQWVKDLLPGFALSFYFHPGEGSYVSVTDWTNCDMSLFQDDDKLLTSIQGLYYIYTCHNPDLAAIRSGVTCIAECMGYYWKSKNMFQVKALQEWADVGSTYPLHYNSYRLFHTGVFLNLMISVSKKFLPVKVAQKFSVGHVSHHGRLDELYLQPSLQAANERMLQRLQQALQLRYDNEASFTL